jgi:4-carboxymuconolactone decarboxylase
MMRAAAALILTLLAGAATAPAQDRMPPIPERQLTEAQRRGIAEFRDARRADLSGPFVPLLRSPELLSRTRALGDYLRFRSALPPRLSEFTILLTARRWAQNYEWDVHAPIAREAGVPADTIAAILADRRPAALSDDEAAIYDFCDELQRGHAVSDATYARALARFGENGVIDLVGIQGYYTLLAMVLNTARTPVPAGHPPAFAEGAR